MKYKIFFIFVYLLIFSLFRIETTFAGEPEIRAILFYSPTCPHCQTVINEVLPELFDEYGNKLVIIGIDVSSEDGQSLYQSAVLQYEIPKSRYGVPTLIVGETVLVGSAEIPEQFPAIISSGLSSGGVDWPNIPGLAKILIEQGLVDQDGKDKEDQIIENSQSSSETNNSDKTAFTDTPQSNLNEAYSSEQVSTEMKEEEHPTANEENNFDKNANEFSSSKLSNSSIDNSGLFPRMMIRFEQDVRGNTLAVIVLFLMIAGVVSVGYAYITDTSFRIFHFPGWIIPLLAVFGLFVAGYLSYIEFTRTEAVCGPVGDCNTVQQSPYAYLFGKIPIGILGTVGYLAILVVWIFQTFGPISQRQFSATVVWIMAWIGVLFSIYLTFLEPFVIGATCAWCLTSAVIITLIFLASTQFVLETDTSGFSELE